MWDEQGHLIRDEQWSQGHRLEGHSADQAGTIEMEELDRQ